MFAYLVDHTFCHYFLLLQPGEWGSQLWIVQWGHLLELCLCPRYSDLGDRLGLVGQVGLVGAGAGRIVFTFFSSSNK